MSGLMHGHCNCGSKISVYFRRSNENVITLRCNITEGNQNCSKIPLRGEERNKVGEILKKKSSYVYRAEQANNLLTEGEKEPSFLPTADVLRKAKSNLMHKHYADPDPVKALHILKLNAMKHIIYNISLSPFMTHYSTKHQDTIYKVLNQKKEFTLAIDATGSIIRPITNPNGEKSGPIFLYSIVGHGPNGSTPIAQMLSERHSTNAISYWLGEWISNAGLPYPYEVVCDGAKALLGAWVRTFTSSSNIGDYADSLAVHPLPKCYIRIDVAHFVKKYANFLSTERRDIKKFYLAVIGQLILVRSLESAQKIIRALITVGSSEYDGQCESGEASACKIQKQILFNVLDSNWSTDHMEQLNVEQNSEGDDYVFDIENGWSSWALNIKVAVEENINAFPGTDLNAYWQPNFFKYLMKDMSLFPMWSCCQRDSFGYGRVPASSAHVEVEFRNIKQYLLKNETIPMRADYFVSKHVAHLKGISKFFDAALTQNTDNVQNNQNEEVELENDSSVFEKCIGCETIILDTGNIFCEKCASVLDVEAGEYVDQFQISGGIHPQEDIVLPTSSTSCPACERGDIPSGAHKCIICKSAVHALDCCSLPYEMDEEGYGQRRICLYCNQETNPKNIIEMRAEENWRGKTNKSCGIYLKDKFPINKLLKNPILADIPIIKPGESKHLQAVKSNKENIDLINTCAFDSIFQLFLDATFDSQLFLKNFITPNIKKVYFVNF